MFYFLLGLLLMSLMSMCAGQNSVDQCLHKGCELTPGISVGELNDTIKSLLSANESHFEDNLLRFMTWNLNLTKKAKDSWLERKKEICDYVIDVQPSILALQQVSEFYLNEIEDCLKEYYRGIVGESVIVNDEKLYNPVFIKYWRKLRVVDDQTFWISETPRIEDSKLNDSSSPIICNWLKVRFAERKSRQHLNTLKYAKKESFKSIILRLLKRYLKKYRKQLAKTNTTQARRPRTKYRWMTFYVAVVSLKMSENETFMEQQTEILTNYLRNTVMGRRRYPVVLMGNFGFEDNSSPYQILEQSPLLHNALLKSRASYPALSLVRSTESNQEGLIDHIWLNNFDVVFAGTLTGKKAQISKTRPIFSAMYPDP